MLIPFIKMHGLGNDYIYFDCLKNPDLIKDPSATAQKVARRHFSIGGDGIVLILPNEEADFQMRMLNPDGSESEMCGNAIRCVAKYVYDYGHTNKKVIKIKTGAGILTLELNIIDEKVESVRVDMGKPVLKGLEIPVQIDKERVIWEQIVTSTSRSYQMTCVSMGNPHAIIFVDEITDEHVLVDGKDLEHNELFPKRANIEFVEILSNDRVKMRVWERGTGETLACGTGASAVAVACVLNEKTDRKVTVELLGGELEIEWAENDHVYMTGPAEIAFTGEVDI